MEFRKARVEDIDEIMAIVNQAKEYFRANKIDQWQKGYPNEESLGLDIDKGELYVLVEADQIKGLSAAVGDGEPTYDKIYEGEWICDGDYVAIHRVAVESKEKGRGFATELFKGVEALARKNKYRSLRVDTHEDNEPMKNLILKNGFEYCGVIYLSDGDKRLAYEKLLD